jgi:hypothetical protein
MQMLFKKQKNKKTKKQKNKKTKKQKNKKTDRKPVKNPIKYPQHFFLKKLKKSFSNFYKALIPPKTS